MCLEDADDRGSRYYAGYLRWTERDMNRWSRKYLDVTPKIAVMLATRPYWQSALRITTCDYAARSFVTRHLMDHWRFMILTEAFILYLSRRWGLDGGLYFDDLYHALRVILHGNCAGLVCLSFLPKAQKIEEKVRRLMDELHLTRSEKGSEVGQRGTYIGVICDSHAGRFNLTDEKLKKMMDDFKTVLERDEFSNFSSLEVWKFRGKLVNYSNCVEGTRPFSVPFDLVYWHADFGVGVGSPQGTRSRRCARNKRGCSIFI